ncbi:MAG TPA: trehalase family glycosidase [Spirochaetota bacterium]|nr:trehalase family glycosidase [Spirochaetota bacterium]
MSVKLMFQERGQGLFLKDINPGNFPEKQLSVTPGVHAYNGSCLELFVKWQSYEIRVQVLGNEQLSLTVAQLTGNNNPLNLIVQAGYFWNQSGQVSLKKNCFKAVADKKKTRLFWKGKIESLPLPFCGPYQCFSLKRKFALSLKPALSPAALERIFKKEKKKYLKKAAAYGKLTELYLAQQAALSWNTIYDPLKKRVITPVSRQWNIRGGGYQLFCWDTFFAAYMASLDNKELAYANAIAILEEKTPQGFVPNFSWATGSKSFDRSQPPVGSFVVWEIYKKYHEKWFLKTVYQDLLKWHRWWQKYRMLDGLPAWGSDPYKTRTANSWEINGVGKRFGAALESGLDNSPMYDQIPMARGCNVLALQDAGLSGLLYLDSLSLSRIALVLKDKRNAARLQNFAAELKKNIDRLWDPKHQIYANFQTSTKKHSTVYAPTCFYPLLAGMAPADKARLMVKKHLLIEKEFWGKWVLPSVSRKEKSYHDQQYWRGRIWAPLNFIVYLGLRYTEQYRTASRLARKSAALVLKEWRQHRHVHENYNADTGMGCDHPDSSDQFYHWGALLAMVNFIDQNIHPAPEKNNG